jgi:hypothetical protein
VVKAGSYHTGHQMPSSKSGHWASTPSGHWASTPSGHWASGPFRSGHPLKSYICDTFPKMGSGILCEALPPLGTLAMETHLRLTTPPGRRPCTIRISSSSGQSHQGADEVRRHFESLLRQNRARR